MQLKFELEKRFLLSESIDIALCFSLSVSSTNERLISNVFMARFGN